MRLPGRIGQVAPAEEHGNNTLPMFMDRNGWTPQEIAQIWESHWKVRYASRIKFLAPASEDVTQDAVLRPRYLHSRLDEVPEHPAVVRLEGSPSIILSLVGQLRVHGSHRPTVGQPLQLQQEEQRVHVQWVDKRHRQQLQLQQGQEGQQRPLPQQQQREERKQERLRLLQDVQLEIQKRQQQDRRGQVHQAEQRPPATVPAKRVGKMRQWAEEKQRSSVGEPQKEDHAVSAELQPAAAEVRTATTTSEMRPAAADLHAATSEEAMRLAERRLAAKLCLDFD